VKLTATFKTAALGVTIKGVSVSASTGIPVARDYVERTAYTGPTEFVPSEETQIVQTKNLRMTDDIVVDPIPRNYGLITYNGSTITVS
jgi:hypothetical protein